MTYYELLIFSGYIFQAEPLFSVRNRSGIIAQHGLSNAKPSIVDLILRLPETNF